MSVLQGTLFLIGLMSAAWTDLRHRQIYDLSSIIIAGAGLISFSPAHLLGLLLSVPFLLASNRGRGGMGDALLIAASCFNHYCVDCGVTQLNVLHNVHRRISLG